MWPLVPPGLYKQMESSPEELGPATGAVIDIIVDSGGNFGVIV